MKKITSLVKGMFSKNVDSAKIKIPPLNMELIKIYSSDIPNEVSLFIPRVEIRETIETPFFKKNKETIYNSITIVNAPRAPLSEENKIEIPLDSKQNKKS